MSEPRFWISFGAFLLALVGVLLWLRWAQANPGLKLMALAPLLWLGHVIAFYVVILSQRLPPTELLTTWSAVLRVHAITTVLGAAIILNGRLRGHE